MKRAMVAAVLTAVFVFAAFAQKSNVNFVLEGRLNTPYVLTGGGTVFLHLTLACPDITLRPDARRPMNIAVVLDRSGSMADERKMDYAKLALNRLIDQLESEDIFSLVVYDDEVSVLRSAKRVGREKSALKRLVSEIYPRNSTNLGDGMIEGLRQVERNKGREYVNRVILLSDGLANRGITNPAQLNSIARRHRTKGISVTTMGVGLDYNENLMIGLAESGGGNYYFIESPAQLAGIMSRELNSASSVLVQNASIYLQIPRGVRVVDVIGGEGHHDKFGFKIPVGDIYSNDSRDVTVELVVPEGVGTFVAAKGWVGQEGKALQGGSEFSATVHYTRDPSSIDRNRDLETQAKVDVARSTRSVERAMKALDEGRKEEAKQIISSAKTMMHASPASGAGGPASDMVQEQADRLDEYGRTLESDDEQRAKKAIQYENYRVQKKKK